MAALLVACGGDAPAPAPTPRNDQHNVCATNPGLCEPADDGGSD